MNKPLAIQNTKHLRVAHSLRIYGFVLGCSLWFSAPTYAGWTEASTAHERGDYATALLEAESAAKLGDWRAQHLLGRMYEAGQGTAKDNQKAFLWYRKAAEGGFAASQNNLGILYSDGRGVLRDDDQAAKWFRLAAEQGSAYGQAALGLSYAEGRGVTKDDELAVKWYRKAAEGGNVMAQNNLGTMYESGRGVAKNDQEAVSLFRRSAEKGYAIAQLNLGRMYADGLGVSRDDQQAYFWFLLASAQGAEHAAVGRDRMERRLSTNQRTEAQVAAREWKPRKGDSSASPSPSFAESKNAPVAARPAGPDSTGSGFVVASTQVVTNAHVIDGCIRVTVGGGQPASILNSDVRSDLALLAVAPTSSFATLRAGRLRQGDAVTVVGYPLRGLLASGAQVTAGNVSALAGMQNDSRFVQITAPVQPGNSGGPLVDSSGNVVGVVVSKLNAVKMAQLTGDIPQNVNFAVSSLALQGFLDASGVDYQTSPSTKNLLTADIADIVKKYTILVECWK